MNKENIFEECFKQWGIAAQFNQAIEEFAEAIMALQGFGSISEEFADSMISLENLMWYIDQHAIKNKGDLEPVFPVDLRAGFAYAIQKIRHFDRGRITIVDLQHVLLGLQTSIETEAKSTDYDRYKSNYDRKMARLKERLKL